MTPSCLYLILSTLLISLHHAFDIPSSCTDESALNGTACCNSLQSQCTAEDAQFECTHAQVGVVNITMRRCGLNSTIPDDITKLAFLRTLDLSFNFLRGSIPEDIGSLGDNAGIHTLDLSNNLLSGSIPKSISNNNMVTSLLYLDLSQNGLTRMNLAAITELKNLVHLDLSNNDIVENFHVTFTEFGSLKYLNLGTNRIAGSIPSAIEALQQLDYFNLERNDMTGELPDEISQIPNLKNLYLSDNKVIYFYFSSLCEDK